jgi:hypothetical protein
MDFSRGTMCDFDNIILEMAFFCKSWQCGKQPTLEMMPLA